VLYPYPFDGPEWLFDKYDGFGGLFDLFRSCRIVGLRVYRHLPSQANKPQVTPTIRFLAVPIAFLAMAGCAGATYHGRMAEAAAPRLTEYDCRPPATAEAVGQATENFMSGHGVTAPTPGDDACEVLLSLGLPSQTDRSATATGRSQSLWYREGGILHLVQITFDPDRTGQLGSHWLVDTVNW
jgi:hypothetical protein